MSFQVIFTTKGALTPDFLKTKRLFFQCYFDFEIMGYGPVILFFYCSWISFPKAFQIAFLV